MSMKSRREYLANARERYYRAKTRSQKSQIIDEVVTTLGYARKYAITVLRHPPKSTARRVSKPRRRKYQAAMSVIQVVWEALDYPCAERLHPVLLSTAEQLAQHGEITLTEPVRQELAQISRATLARRIAAWQKPSARKFSTRSKPLSKLRSEIPVDTYHWDENRPGALEIDLVEHNGGSSIGHFAYTISVVDVVTGYSRRRAILGRSQRAVLDALQRILDEWPYPVWGLHTDNGAEFINNHLLQFTKQRGLQFTRSRPYKKNDNAHVEQKNRALVREIVGYARYDTPQHVDWLNTVYGWLDVYANACLPIRKIIRKRREGSKVRKWFDEARTPLQRFLERDILSTDVRHAWAAWAYNLNPLQIHHQLETLLRLGPDGAITATPPEPFPQLPRKEGQIV
ncbi:DDE-type integrase/transposase/recombinase [Alicyclobacillus herbarius]|uniref:DDE-type integrase/transposase/recombinase n=1 Tax=Alicyclobacillus herbarius TaxID=122960 RepID=UPI002355A8A2|nr:DDE-type integrase/transposase/recombinase [Alicyclobacillus herbarius]